MVGVVEVDDIQSRLFGKWMVYFQGE